MSRINADVLGIGIRLTCTVHCVVLPMLISVLPAMGFQLFSHEFIEYSTIAAAAVAGIYSLRYGYKNHRKLTPAMIFITGFLLLAWKQIFIPTSEGWPILIPALFLIIVAHSYNYRLCRRPAANRS